MLPQSRLIKPIIESFGRHPSTAGRSSDRRMALYSPLFNQLHHRSNLQWFRPYKRPSALSSTSFHLFTYSISKHQLHPRFFTVRADINYAYAESHIANDVHVNYAASKTKPLSNGEEASSWAIPQTSGVEMTEKTSTRTHGRSVDEVRDANKLSEYKNSRYDFDSRSSSKMGGFVSGISPLSSKEENLLSEISKITGMMGLQFKKGNGNRAGGEKLGRGKNKKVNSPEFQFRIGLDMCSKRGNILGAIRLFELARREGFKMDQYHYTVLLYLCSSAAIGVVQPGKSGSGGRSLNILKVSDSESRVGGVGDMGKKNSDQLFSGSRTPDLDRDSDGNHHFLGFKNAGSLSLSGLNHLKGGDSNESGAKEGENSIHEEGSILFGENIQKYALQKGFEIYERLCLDEVQMNEATLTSVARLAASVGNGDIAFDMVKQMKLLGLSPRLRSYGPALSAFCNTGEIEKAFSVETHMLENGINPEEPELEALLRVSVEAGKDDKVYDLLHKLRKTVRKVSPSTADLVIKWFTSKPASRVGKRKWNKELIQEAMENGGGGWHGLGWLKRGRWIISQADVEPNGLCKCCGEKLALIDLDPTETENFAESVASLAIQRERNSSFQKFQKWLDYYGPFEAVVDAANVGLFREKRLEPSKISAVVNGIRQKLPSKRWPLIILHNQRISGYKTGERVNKTLIEKWKNGDAVYATPTGSNDDWYWLYAAIKFKCFLVTNDEMRDHTFQLLGNDFFPKWKERHQVHFSFSDTGPELHMPLPYTVAIQESENGHWHLPVMSEKNPDGKTTWLCITRHASDTLKQDCFAMHQGSETATQTQTKGSPVISSHQDHTKTLASEMHKKLRDVFSSTVLTNHHHTILPQIEAAENLGDCPLDFQI